MESCEIKDLMVSPDKPLPLGPHSPMGEKRRKGGAFQKHNEESGTLKVFLLDGLRASLLDLNLKDNLIETAESISEISTLTNLVALDLRENAVGGICNYRTSILDLVPTLEKFDGQGVKVADAKLPEGVKDAVEGNDGASGLISQGVNTKDFDAAMNGNVDVTVVS